MVTLTEITNPKCFAFIVFLVFKLFSHKIIVYKQKRQEKVLKSRLLFKRIKSFMGALQQNYKSLKCETSGYTLHP